MEESSVTTAPSILDGDNYETWVVRMTIHLQALDVWEVVEENYEVPPLVGLVEKGFKVYFEDRNCIIKDAEGKEVFNIKLNCKSFALNLLEDEHAVVLQQDIEELPEFEKDLPICAICQYGKQTKLSFPKKTSWRATQKLQLVHNDVGGPQKTPSLKGRNNVGLVNKFKAEMKQVLEMTDLGEMTYFLGKEVHQQQHDIFIYSDWVGCVDDMRSTSGCFSFGYSIFSWSSKKQEVMAQSTAEAEYVAVVDAVNQVFWFRKLLTDLDMKQEMSTQVFVDNQAAISITNDPVFHGKTKHFKIKLYFLIVVQKEMRN
ncbi:Copia protein [Vitis vinifera]|uniref:Copia protein n=1 Tax=Vitis vinifera TaxID=29760 RepID=A0A438JAP6_VITVI|nr:Copia protein [Vitis vinifera]